MSLVVEGLMTYAPLVTVSTESRIVDHNGAVPLARVDDQPNGRFGTVTPSKFSSSAILGRPIIILIN